MEKQEAVQKNCRLYDVLRGSCEPEKNCSTELQQEKRMGQSSTVRSDGKKKPRILEIICG